MGSETSQESNYYIDLQIDKASYQIQDKLQGHVEFKANQASTKYDLELRLQFIAEYQQQAWESVGGDNTFIFQEQIIKNCSKDDIQIHEKASFQYDLDLISTTTVEDGWFFVKYYIRAIIQHRFGEHLIQLLYKDNNFYVNRPYVRIQRPIQMESKNQIKTVFCCNYGEIKLKVSLDEKDFLINDVAKIKIECDQSLSSTTIESFQINLLAKTTYRDSRDTCQPQKVFNTISFPGSSNKQYQTTQSLPIICEQKFKNWFHSSLECPNLTHSYFIQLVCNPGLFKDKIILEIPIILYWTQLYQLKLHSNLDNVNRTTFNPNNFQQFKADKFIEYKIKQEKWKDQIIDFPIQEQQIQNQEMDLNSNLIRIQSNLK
ncbi:hypothetical protein pb186bvf_017843 [Paramecium bursaria]